ncbi:hypothetical protein CBFG_03627 [Clostridiales bacterium 1_7_47FAA]|nr:hypothetical protein CBFG_03627 [Clostridiales bacterium 1_7_47FAA]
MKCNIQNFQPHYSCGQPHIRRKAQQKWRNDSRKGQQAAIHKNPEKPGIKKRPQEPGPPPQADCQKNGAFPGHLGAEYSQGPQRKQFHCQQHQKSHRVKVSGTVSCKQADQPIRTILRRSFGNPGPNRHKEDQANQQQPVFPCKQAPEVIRSQTFSTAPGNGKPPSPSSGYKPYHSSHQNRRGHSGQQKAPGVGQIVEQKDPMVESGQKHKGRPGHNRQLNPEHCQQIKRHEQPDRQGAAAEVAQAKGCQGNQAVPQKYLPGTAKDCGPRRREDSLQQRKYLPPRTSRRSRPASGAGKPQAGNQDCGHLTKPKQGCNH